MVVVALLADRLTDRGQTRVGRRQAAWAKVAAPVDVARHL
jgi:hypothetical protein